MLSLYQKYHNRPFSVGMQSTANIAQGLLDTVGMAAWVHFYLPSPKTFPGTTAISVERLGIRG